MKVKAVRNLLMAAVICLCPTITHSEEEIELKQVLKPSQELRVYKQGYDVNIVQLGDKVIVRDDISYSIGFPLSTAVKVGDSTVYVMALYSGGTACPAQYRFMTINDYTLDVTMSADFGTCSDVIQQTVNDDGIYVCMPNDSGNTCYVYLPNGGVAEVR